MKTFYDTYVQCSKCNAEIQEGLLLTEKPAPGDWVNRCEDCAEKYEERTGFHYDDFVVSRVEENERITDPDVLGEWYEEDASLQYQDLSIIDKYFRWDEDDGCYVPVEDIEIVSVTVFAMPPWERKEREWITMAEIPRLVQKGEEGIRTDWKRGKFDPYLASGYVQESGATKLFHIDALKEFYKDDWIGEPIIEMEKKYSVCIDLNGVLDTYSGWKGEEHEEMPKEGAKEFLEKLAADYRVILLTTVPGHKVWSWLKKYGMDHLIAKVTDKKPPAVAYVDDRAILFDGDYEKTLEQIRHFRPHWKK